MTKDFLQLCKERGYLHQCTDEEGLSALFRAEPVTAYIGFDCTAPSLHVGSLLQIMMLRHLQQCGHKPIVLMGGGTTKVGDPSGKDKTREMLSYDAIEANMNGIKSVFTKFLTFGDGPTDAIMLNNDDWLSKLTLPFMMQNIWPAMSVNRMLAKESVKQRLERQQHLSLLEFNYMVLQAYDFVELYKHQHCRLQIGGSDQWGNITAGIDLHQHLNHEDKTELFGLTSPLITTASGAKMGKTASGAIWLNEDLCSPYDYWQFWRNTEDADVIRFLKLFTELPLEQIAEYESWLGTAQINDAKIILANEATTLLHGEAAAKEAAETARAVFEQGGVGEALPEFVIPELAEGVPAFKLLQEAGLAKSGKEARQKIREKAAKVNDVAIEDENQPISQADLTDDGHIKLSVGKKRHALVKAA